MAGNCDKCKKPASNKCGQCNTIFYCSANCQKLAWPAHKSLCLMIKQYGCEGVLKMKRDDYIKKQIESMHGNVMIIASHNLGSEIIVNINETIDTFTSNKNHCVFLTAKPCDDNIVKNVDMILVNVILDDYQYSLNIPIGDRELFNKLKAQYPNPGEDWPVFF